MKKEETDFLKLKKCKEGKLPKQILKELEEVNKQIKETREDKKTIKKQEKEIMILKKKIIEFQEEIDNLKFKQGLK